MMVFNEFDYENSLIELFTEQLGYEYIRGSDIERDYEDPFYRDILVQGLQNVNPGIAPERIQDAIRKLEENTDGTLIERNKRFMEYLQGGVPVTFIDPESASGEERTVQVRLADYKNPEKNLFYLVNQWRFTERGTTKRADMVVFVNGLPLVVIELKSPSREETDASEAYQQLRTYISVIPTLFVNNAFVVMSDVACSKAGTITADESRFMEWKTKDGESEIPDIVAFDTFFEGLFQKERFLDLLRNFILFSSDTGRDAKIMAGYHQYFAVKKAVKTVTRAATDDGKYKGKGGVFWHTQGSGKSLSMVFFAHLIQQVLESPTILVLTDRNDLDGQLFAQFSKCAGFLRQTPIQAESREDLRRLLIDRKANGIIFSTIQKFEEGYSNLSDRRNIVVMSDEAHRGHYGLNGRIDPETGEMKYGIERVIRDSLPNASYIGFTGTPISSKDKSTREVFGDYIDIYDMTQAVKDGATRPVYYESRVIKLRLEQDVLNRIDAAYDEMAESVSDSNTLEKSKREMARIDSLLGADMTISAFCDDFLDHYENYRAHLLTGKAMIVAYSRPIAMKIYRRILQLRPSWTDKIKVVMTSGNQDPEEWAEIIGNKAARTELAREFKDDDSPFKIVIVVDMWLTGFDVPSLSTMYVYKPMSGHNLMQAIARVNRVYKDKEGGLVVDYVGIASALKQAMNDYTKRDQEQYGDPDVSGPALNLYREKLEICRGFLHGFDYSGFMNGSNLNRALLLQEAANFLLAPAREPEKDEFLKQALSLHQAGTLCASLLTQPEREEGAFFEAVRTILTRIRQPGTISLKEINSRITSLLKQAVKSDGVINLFQDKSESFSIFDQAFLDEVMNMKQKNIAVELLKRLIQERITGYRRTNLVQAEKFSDLFIKTMNRYVNGHITNEEVLEELRNIAFMIQKAREEGQELGLTAEEQAFYDALIKPDGIEELYKSEELIAMTKEIAELLRQKRTIDWQKKETARAEMRLMVKRLLKKYKYPPEEQKGAIESIISQCELWADNMDEV